MRVLSAIALSAAVLAAPAPAPAESTPPEQDQQRDQGMMERPSELAIEATRKLMRALELLIQSLPQYGTPRIDENGNIIIPRLPGPPPRPEPKPQPPERDRGGAIHTSL
jgi:hypothetical protein